MVSRTLEFATSKSGSKQSTASEFPLESEDRVESIRIRIETDGTDAVEADRAIAASQRQDGWQEALAKLEQAVVGLVELSHEHRQVFQQLESELQRLQGNLAEQQRMLDMLTSPSARRRSQLTIRGPFAP